MGIKNWPLVSKIGLGFFAIGIIFARLAQNSNWNLSYTITFITCFVIGFIAVSIGSSKIPRSAPLNENFFETKIENKSKDQFRQLFQRYSTTFGFVLIALILLASLDYFLFDNLWVAFGVIVIIGLLNSVFRMFIWVGAIDAWRPNTAPESRHKWQSFILGIFGVTAIIAGIMIWYSYNYYGPAIIEEHMTKCAPWPECGQDWRNYSNSALGFQISYPRGWIIDDNILSQRYVAFCPPELTVKKSKPCVLGGMPVAINGPILLTKYNNNQGTTTDNYKYLGSDLSGNIYYLSLYDLSYKDRFDDMVASFKISKVRNFDESSTTTTTESGSGSTYTSTSSLKEVPAATQDADLPYVLRFTILDYLTHKPLSGINLSLYNYSLKGCLECGYDTSTPPKGIRYCDCSSNSSPSFTALTDKNGKVNFRLPDFWYELNSFTVDGHLSSPLYSGNHTNTLITDGKEVQLQAIKNSSDGKTKEVEILVVPRSILKIGSVDQAIEISKENSQVYSWLTNHKNAQLLENNQPMSNLIWTLIWVDNLPGREDPELVVRLDSMNKTATLMETTRYGTY